MASSDWEVTFFEITTPTGSGNTTTLYANGRMQVPVDIAIKATVGNHPYKLSDEELDSITLVRYVEPDHALPNGWGYTAAENEFDHVLPGGAQSVSGYSQIESEDEPTPGPNPTEEALSETHTPRAEPQVKRYWVTTTGVESERVAASIESPLGIVTTHSDESGFDSYVALTGTAPITYYQEDLVTDKYDDHADHEIHKWENGKCHLQHVYVSFKNGRLLKSEVTGVNLNSAYKEAVIDWTDGLDLHYVFDMALREEEVGDWHDKYPNMNWVADVNKKKGKLNLGRCAIRGEVPWGHDLDWCSDNLIILYDRCGNSGRFKAVIDNDWDTGGSRIKDYQ